MVIASALPELASLPPTPMREATSDDGYPLLDCAAIRDVARKPVAERAPLSLLRLSDRLCSLSDNHVAAFALTGIAQGALIAGIGSASVAIGTPFTLGGLGVALVVGLACRHALAARLGPEGVVALGAAGLGVGLGVLPHPAGAVRMAAALHLAAIHIGLTLGTALGAALLQHNASEQLGTTFERTSRVAGYLCGATAAVALGAGVAVCCGVLRAATLQSAVLGALICGAAWLQLRGALMLAQPSRVAHHFESIVDVLSARTLPRTALGAPRVQPVRWRRGVREVLSGMAPATGEQSASVAAAGVLPLALLIAARVALR